MNSIWLMIGSFLFFALAYRVYGRFLDAKMFDIRATNPVPSKELRDDIDYVPTKKRVLFGHHFASIAGTGPIVGPAIAVIWGWGPVFLWILLGSVFIGAVHDYAALVISVRNKGVSIGELTKDLINGRVHKIFLAVIFFSLWIVVAIFGMVIASIFQLYPQSVVPVWTQIPIAVILGWFVFKKNVHSAFLPLAAVVLMYISIFVGANFPVVMPSFFGFPPASIWIVMLFVYAFIASVLPVWSLLQPRDYINSYQLIIGVVLLVLGVFFSRPVIVAPIVNVSPAGAPPLIPFLFITIACGAVSGFHSLVSSGTTSKQLANEKDARIIGFGGMLVEGFLAVLVLIAVAAGIGKVGWNSCYSNWAAMQGLSSKVASFVNGSANMLSALGISYKYSTAMICVFVASFAGTTLDTATRIQRYILSEIAVSYNIKPLRGRYSSTAFVVVLAMLLAFSAKGGKGALLLWPLFGTCNQLLAALTLLVVTVYLMRKKKKTIGVLIPMIFMLLIAGWAMIVNNYNFFISTKWHLLVLGSMMFLLQIWMVVEVILLVKNGFLKGLSKNKHLPK